MRRLPQSTAYTVMLKLFLSSDHVSAATGKTVAITISKAGGAFANPNAGATNATEVSNGWYKVTLDTTDTGTLGDLVVRGTATSCDDAEQVCQVVKATNGGLTALPDAAAEAAGGLYTRGSGAGQINQPANGVIDANVVRNAGTAITAAAGVQEVKVASIAANAITATAIAADAITDAKVASDVTIASVTGSVGSVTGNVGGNVTGSVGSVATGGITSGSFAAGAIDNAAIATDAIGSAELAASAASEIGTAVWAVATRELTSGNNIALAKGTGITGFNDLSAAQVNAEADTALSDAGVTSVRMAHLDADVSSRLASGTYTAPDNASITAIKGKTDNLPSDPADASDIAAAFGIVGTAITSLQSHGDSAWATADVSDLPTNAELATALDGADDAVLAAIAALNNLSAADVNAQADQALADAGVTTVRMGHLDVDVSTRASQTSVDGLAIPAASDNADAILAATYEGSETVQDHFRLARAALYGKANGLAGSTVHFRDAADSKNRLTATVDADGNRSAVTTDAT